MKQLAVVGIGNLLLTDDGIGIHAVQTLEKEFPREEILYVDQGTAIFELISLFTEFEDIFILDALDGGHPVGTIFKVPLDQLENYTQNNSSLHDVQVMDLFQKVKLMGHEPSITVLGIQPAEVEVFDMELSAEMKIHFDTYTSFIKDEINQFFTTKEVEPCA